MSYGLQLFNANGDLCLDTGDTLPRRIAAYSQSASVGFSLLNTVWQHVMNFTIPEIAGLQTSEYFIVLGSRLVEDKRIHQANNITDQTLVTGYIQDMPPSYVVVTNSATGNVRVEAMVSTIVYDEMPFGSQDGNWWLLYKTHFVTLQIFRY